MKKLRPYLHIIIALIGLLVIKFGVQPGGDLTPVGVNVLALLFFILYLWLTVGTDWVSLLCLAGVAMTSIMTPAASYGASIGSSTTIIVLTCMGINKVLSTTGVIKKISHWFLTREIVRNRPYVFIAMFFLAVTVMGLFLEVLTLSILFITLIGEICEEIGYKKGDAFYTALILGTFWLSNVTNAATPISHAVPLIMIGTAAASGINISYSQYMSLGIPFAIVMYLLTILIVCVIWKPEASKYKNYDLDAAQKQKVPLTTEGKITLSLFIALILVWVVPEILPGIFPEAIKETLSFWGNSIPAIFVMCLLCVINVNDKPIAKFNEMASVAPMSLLIFTGAVTVLGSAVSSPDSGISATLNAILSPISESLNITVLIAMGILLCLVMTNFISNVVSMLLFFGMMIPLIAGTAVSPVGITIIICLAACFASLVPSANVTAPVYFGPNHITVKNSLKWNLIMIAACFAVCLIILYPLSGVIF